MFQCDHCPKQCRNKELINHHLRVHFGCKEFKCEMCGKGFNRSNIRDRHRLNHLELVKCEICSRRVKSNNIKQHMIIHSCNRKIHQCHICSTKFTKNYSLRDHLLLHESPDVFRCEPCEKSFKSRDSLLRHRKEIHENWIKRHKCTRCDYETNDKRNITRHESKHTREDEKLSSDVQWVKCKKCPTMLKSEKSLWHHLRQVHPKSNFICHLCSAVYKTNQHLKKHFESVHAKE
jgi:Zinc finger, C2H2 type